MLMTLTFGGCLLLLTLTFYLLTLAFSGYLSPRGEPFHHVCV